MQTEKWAEVSPGPALTTIHTYCESPYYPKFLEAERMADLLHIYMAAYRTPTPSQFIPGSKIASGILLSAGIPLSTLPALTPPLLSHSPVPCATAASSINI